MFNHGSGSPFQQQTVTTLELKILNCILNSVLGVANIVGTQVVVAVSKIKFERLNFHIGAILLYCSTTIVVLSSTARSGNTTASNACLVHP